MPKVTAAPTAFRDQNDGLQRFYSELTSENGLVLDDDGKLVPDVSRTQQSHQNDCDINIQLARFTASGGTALPNGTSKTPQFGDFIGAPDFQRALDVVINAENAFAELDVHLRRKFGNDPAEYLAWVNDPANIEEGIKLGLFVAREPLPPAKQESSVDDSLAQEGARSVSSKKSKTE